MRSERSFRPRLGMGWFTLDVQISCFPQLIFVPAWGWVGSQTRSKCSLICKIFVPTWGWVGSLRICVTQCWLLHFRPRVGMGWFGTPDFYMTPHMLFSSPSGDGLVLDYEIISFTDIEFSSPSGDGLVQGVVKQCCQDSLYFRPRLGMGWFVADRQTRGLSLHFRPRVGMGWFLRVNAAA